MSSIDVAYCTTKGKGGQRGGGMPKSPAWNNFTVVCPWRGVYASSGPLQINRIQAHVKVLNQRKPL